MNLNNYDKLIIAEARRYVKSIDGYDLDDLIQEGRLKFLIISKCHKPKKGKFSTFLVTCLRNHYRSLMKKKTPFTHSGIDFDKIPSKPESRNSWEDVCEKKPSEPTIKAINHLLKGNKWSNKRTMKAQGQPKSLGRRVKKEIADHVRP